MMELDEQSPWDVVVGGIWQDCDDRRQSLVDHYGDSLGRWLADVQQYGAAWAGDVWESEAIRCENHPAFSTIDQYGFWDHEPFGTFVVRFHMWTDDAGEMQHEQDMVAASMSLAGGKVHVCDSPPRWRDA